ncbi:glycosyltransferase [Avibacterium sp. 20-15]|uniref:glycosyltransferase family protein n=1 Tax=unclassified Avibacterium TaxID=2685287 RepID=UPI002026C1EF|nr:MULTISPECIES: glycosyltransferase [unclassified Avibacterium]MCW9732358.1 glycosyltransferase [Avibacterium sp. 20-15]URL04524.1 glycosyltransferase [Avibacterium sp. 20-132]
MKKTKKRNKFIQEKQSSDNLNLAEDLNLIKKAVSDLHQESIQSFNFIIKKQNQHFDELSTIKSLQLKLETLQKANSEQEHTIIKLKKDLANTAEKIAQAKKNVENTLSFKLGYALIHSTKSWSNFYNLPTTLWNIRKLAKKRKDSPKTISSSKTLPDFSVIEGKFKKQYGFRFISILDEISHVSFGSEFRLFPLNKASYEQQIKGSSSLGFFIESCWKGNFGAWEYAFTSPNLQHNNAQALLKALEISKNRNFPVIFWNKEDPMHYDKFLPIAKKCDFIFTTDSNKVADYQRDVPNAKVEALLFAANINICNPANRFRTEQENICFAGSYYSVGHDDRKKQMDALLPAIKSCKGVIYDRMSQLDNKRYAYPRKYRKYIRPAVPFKEIVNVYRKFKIFLNVNTITDSPTMMSRRVYELLACGTPVISTPSLAIEKQFKGIVQIARTGKEAKKIADRLLNNEWEWLRLSHRGYREVMLYHTYEQRAIQIVNALGQKIEQYQPLASIVMASNRPKFIDRIVENVTQQVYPNIELIIIAQNYSDEQIGELKSKINKSDKKFINVHIIKNDSDDTLGNRLNQAIHLTTGEYVAKFDDDDFYFPHYLQDMLIPFKFGDYGIVGKKEIFIYLESLDKTYVRFKGQHHLETNFLTGATLVFSRKALDKLKFGNLNRGEDSNILEQANKLGIKMYVADPFNFIVYRAKDINNHTWQVSDNFFTEKGEFIGNELAREITVV